VSPVASSIRDLDGAWLSGVLGTEVRTVTARPIGTGQTSSTYLLHLDADGCPPTLVVKLAEEDIDARLRVAAGHRSEVGFYTHLAARVDIPTARCWHAAITDDGASFTLIMDDLSPRRPGRQIDGCRPGPAEAAVVNLAGLHAPLWNDPSLVTVDFLPPPSAARSAFLADLYRSATTHFVERGGSDLGPDDVATLRQTGEILADWLTARRDPFSLIHGDYRLDNLMFSPSDPTVVAVDWQTAAVGLPARDLSYFLGTSIETEARRSAETQLVRRYHDALLARGVAGYPFDRCYDDYRFAMFHGPLITVLGSMMAMAERNPDSDRMFVAMARRSCAAIRDLGSFDTL
jgi:Ser/Thr protein kinase RdoA (MazF antagonist)